MSAALDRLCVGVATGMGLGALPARLVRGTHWERRRWTGAGLVGTALGAASLGLLPESCGAQAAFLAAAVLIASWAAGRAEASLGSHDDPRILIDETVGYWTAVLCLPRAFWVLAAAFALFRALDSVKLPPYRWLERLPGGLGVVMDDVGAGAVANLLLRLCL